LPLIRGENPESFDRACVTATPDQKVLITSSWSLRLASTENQEPESAVDAPGNELATSRAELFVKPDDWFEVNNVADRCPEIVEKMQAALEETVAACRAEAPAKLATLPSELNVDFE
jgi:hypothetical protein